MISAVIPVYNRQDFLPVAIESVLNQTYPSFELIIINDGSTDDSLNVAKSYAVQDSRVKIFSTPHKGVAQALAYGFEQSKYGNKYLCQVDSDDYLLPDCFKTTYETIKDNDLISLVCTQYYELNESLNTINIPDYSFLEVANKLVLSHFLTSHFRLINKLHYNQVGGIDKSFLYACDYDLCLRLSEVGEVIKLSQLLYVYRIHANQQSKNFKAQDNYARLALRNAIKRRTLVVR